MLRRACKRIAWVCLAGAASAGSVAMAQQAPEQTIAGLKAADGLAVSLWANEPGITKPTNMDIDERGRVWITEGANYRSVHRRDGGDRIMILEDTKHTGVCDSYKVFVQDPKIASPLGICKLGNKLIVAQSPSILIYTIDASGDHPVGEPQVLLTGFAGVNHDHGVHSGVFGPDGRYYFTAGNEGGRGYIKTADGKPVIDRTGSEIGMASSLYRGKPKDHTTIAFREGLALSCNLDGSDMEVIGYDFRNNFELCVDSFGTVWQSDNDDDGNQGVRINYLMEGGDFGYTGPHGSAWTRDMSLFPHQTHQEAQWHTRFPGIVPNTVLTGAGAPTGILIYEGDLLPPVYRNALLHCDAGRNVVQAYVTHPSSIVPTTIGFTVPPADVKSSTGDMGAGYDADIVSVLKLNEKGDHWFRPSDLTVAPDGSLFVCDWYDPGVGGHATGDPAAHMHGRVYHIAPPGFKSPEIKLDLSNVAGQIAALCSPNLSTRYLGYTSLLAGGDDAHQALQTLFTTSENPRLRARALWLLAREKTGPESIQAALKDKDADIRITAFRAARAVKMDIPKLAEQLLSDPSIQMQRELCLAMNFEPDNVAIPLLVKLADKYDGQDRWYLEAFGIGCVGRETKVLEAWEKDHKTADAKIADAINWRLKMQAVPSDMASLDKSAQTVTSWMALAGFPNEGVDKKQGPEDSPGAVDLLKSYDLGGGKVATWAPVKCAVGRWSPDHVYVDFNQVCAARGVPVEHVAGYFTTNVIAATDEKATLMVGSDDGVKVWLNGKLVHRDEQTRAMQYGDDLIPVMLKKGNNLLLCKLTQGDGDSGIIVSVAATPAVTFGIELAGASAVQPALSSNAAPASDATLASAKTPAATFQLSANADPKKQFKSKGGALLPPIGELTQMTGDVAAGEQVFKNTSAANCIRCHQIGAEGAMIGPPLTVIGSKLNKGQIYEAILYPSAQILMHYESWIVRTKQGDVFTGLQVEDVPNDHVTIKDADGKFHDIAAKDIDRKVMQKISLMPEGLAESMSKQDLVNLVEYLSSRKQ